MRPRGDRIPEYPTGGAGYARGSSASFGREFQQAAAASVLE
jgi:hypothetical protein